tara:strand:+ start:645 stop:1133 length:489 start_codon:yes stop_codon:yes gene_type:complete
MKKIIYPLIFIFILTGINSCAGYKPIFGASDLKIKITKFEVSGDKQLGRKIYNKLNNLSKSNSETDKIKNISIKIDTSKNKIATVKNSTGKILAYRINLSSKIIITDSETKNQILNTTISNSSTYQVQDQFSETIKLEKKSEGNLIIKTYEDLVIKLSENIL